MKYLLFLIFTITICNTSFCQDSLVYDNDNRIYKVLKKNGEVDYYDLQGVKKNVYFCLSDSIYLKDKKGIIKLDRLIQEGLIFPKKSLSYVSSTVTFVISVVLNTDGSISNIRIIEGIQGFSDNELINNLNKISEHKFDHSKIEFLPCEFTLTIYLSHY